MNEVYVRIYGYIHHPTGFGDRKPLMRYNVGIAAVHVLKPHEIKAVANELEHRPALELADEWSKLLGCPIRYFKEKRVTTVSEEEVDSMPSENIRSM